MILIVLGILGVPVWLMLGALVTTLWARRRTLAQPQVFRVKHREPGSERWPRSVSGAEVIHDVLVLRPGPEMLRAVARGVVGATVLETGKQIKPFASAIVYELTFDDGSKREVAVDAGDAPHVDPLVAGGTS